MSTATDSGSRPDRPPPLTGRATVASSRRDSSPMRCSTRATCCIPTGRRRRRTSCVGSSACLPRPRYAKSSGSERSSMRSEVIVDPGEQPTLHVRIRCLQVQRRLVEATTDGGVSFPPVDSLDYATVEGESRTIMPWDEALEHEIDVDPVALLSAAGSRRSTNSCCRQRDDVELLGDHRGEVVGRAIRRCEDVHGLVRISATRIDGRPSVAQGLDRCREHDRLGTAGCRSRFGDAQITRRRAHVCWQLTTGRSSRCSILRLMPSTRSPVAATKRRSRC